MINKLKLARCAVNTTKQMVPSLLRRLGTCKQGGGRGGRLKRHGCDFIALADPARETSGAPPGGGLGHGD